jgi:hypothetical protein
MSFLQIAELFEVRSEVVVVSIMRHQRRMKELA